MASVDFKKMKGASEVKAMLRHCDKEERLKHEHSNPDIDKSQTVNNKNYLVLGEDKHELTYKESCHFYDKRIKELDMLAGANKRKDRVTCFGLLLTSPEGMDLETSDNFFGDCVDIFIDRYGIDNIVSAIAHYDEIHSYKDKDGVIRESRPHLEVFVIPEIDGKLNGKVFSSKKNMIELNQQIDKMAQEKYECKFLTHEKPRKRTVEELKAASEAIAKGQEEIVREIDNLIKDNNKLREDLNKIGDRAEKTGQYEIYAMASNAVDMSDRRWKEYDRKRKNYSYDMDER